MRSTGAVMCKITMGLLGVMATQVASAAGEESGPYEWDLNVTGRYEQFRTGGIPVWDPAYGYIYTMLHQWKEGANGEWTPWSSMGGQFIAQRPAAALDCKGRMHLFAVAKNAKVYAAWQTVAGSDWKTDWTPMGGGEVFSDGSYTNRNVARTIDAIRDEYKRIQIFVIGEDGEVYSLWQKTPCGEWSAWTKIGLIGGRAKTDLDVLIWPNAETNLFVLGSDAYVWNNHHASGGNWSGWHRAGD
ncbi:MAG: hypothetical protein HY308_09025 [Gammaproteobacteria bacterium]|nr:hypothetical protein [Gammaproteobacteria bacterium]